MIKVNVEKFLADYNAKLEEKAEKSVSKDDAIKAEIAKAEKIVVDNGYNEEIKEVFIKKVVAEKEKEFDFTEIDKEIALFEQYVDIVEDEETEEVVVENENVDGEIVEGKEEGDCENVENVVNNEPKRDVFGNIITE